MREFSWRSRKQWCKTHLELDLRVTQEETIKEPDLGKKFYYEIVHKLKQYIEK